MPKTKELTIESMIADHAKDIAFVAEENPTTTLDDFISQLGTTASRLDRVGINGSEDLEDAATYLADLAGAGDEEKPVLLKKAAKPLSRTWDMVDEYRGMV